MTRSITRRSALRLAVAACVALPAVAVLGGCDANDEPVMKYVSVSLPANAGTGYSWTCEVDKPEVLELTGDDVVDESGSSTTNGGKVSYVFFFEGRSEGIAVVSFKLERPWEEDAEPAEWVTYRFSVGADLAVTEDSHEGTVEPGVVYSS